MRHGFEPLRPRWHAAGSGWRTAIAEVGSTPEWYIQQGRVYAKKSIIEEVEASVEASRRQLQSPGNGFGLHLVNVSNHLTTGGMSTAQVEAEFVSKLGNMATFDSFMDFNVLFYTTALEEYVPPLRLEP